MRRLLVVEDELSMKRLLRTELEALDFEVGSADTVVRARLVCLSRGSTTGQFWLWFETTGSLIALTSQARVDVARALVCSLECESRERGNGRFS